MYTRLASVSMAMGVFVGAAAAVAAGPPELKAWRDCAERVQSVQVTPGEPVDPAVEEMCGVRPSVWAV